jgi:hypothetical protein
MTSRATYGRTSAVGVTLPVHNEEKTLRAALSCLENSFSELECSGLLLHASIVLDACGDESRDIARAWKRDAEQRGKIVVDLVECGVTNVGLARALGCGVLLRKLRGTDPSSIWLATSDADSLVPQNWLAAQLESRDSGADVWVGRVFVTDWTRHRWRTAQKWRREYERESRPVHGANLGFTASCYLDAGGFRSLRTSEDRALLRDLINCDAVVHYDSDVRVATSSRRHARAPEGFASALTAIDAALESGIRTPRWLHSVWDERVAG